MMRRKKMICAFCGHKINIVDKIGRKDTCPKCNGDLRCCRQCFFFEARAYNECKEIMAERVVDKDRANFCDYFVANNTQQGRASQETGRQRGIGGPFQEKDVSRVRANTTCSLS